MPPHAAARARRHTHETDTPYAMISGYRTGPSETTSGFTIVWFDQNGRLSSEADVVNKVMVVYAGARIQRSARESESQLPRFPSNAAKARAAAQLGEVWTPELYAWGAALAAALRLRGWCS